MKRKEQPHKLLGQAVQEPLIFRKKNKKRYKLVMTHLAKSWIHTIVT